MDNLSKYYNPGNLGTHRLIAAEAEKFMRENSLKVYGRQSNDVGDIVFFPEEDFSDYLFDDADIKQFDSFLLDIFSQNKIYSIVYKMVILQNIELSKFRFTRYSSDFRQWTKVDSETKFPNKALALCHASIVKPATTFSKKISFRDMENNISQQSAHLELKKGNAEEPIHFKINKTEEDWYSVRQFVFVEGYAEDKIFECDDLKGVLKLIQSFIL